MGDNCCSIRDCDLRAVSKGMVDVWTANKHAYSFTMIHHRPEGSDGRRHSCKSKIQYVNSLIVGKGSRDVGQASEVDPAQGQGAQLLAGPGTFA